MVKCLDDASVIVIPRMMEDKFIEFAVELKKKGLKIVIDHDDNMFKISPLSPHYEAFGVENVKVPINGSLIDLWQDGKNINLTENKRRVDNFKRALQVADIVTVTQPILADVYREYNQNVKILPNCVDLNLWKKLPLKPRDEIRMGWFGGHSHYEDWCLLQDVLPGIMRRHKNLKLVILGQMFQSTLKSCPQDRVEHHGWVNTFAYPYKAAILDLDFAIIPLVDNEFNRCKSNIKWVEMGALEVPAVTSYVSPYKESYSGNNGIFVEGNDAEGWETGIEFMIENPDKRIEMGKEARKTVEQNFNVWDKCHLWSEAYS
jgi:glycosyltransferase involved in cell wall biosynthesis